MSKIGVSLRWAGLDVSIGMRKLKSFKDYNSYSRESILFREHTNQKCT